METMLFNVATDVWSYGVLMLEIYLDGGRPYQGMSNQAVISRVTSGYRAPRPAGCSSAVYDAIILRCWDNDALQRPSFNQISNDLGRLLATLGGQGLTMGACNEDGRAQQIEATVPATLLPETSGYARVSTAQIETATLAMQNKDGASMQPVTAHEDNTDIGHTGPSVVPMLASGYMLECGEQHRALAEGVVGDDADAETHDMLSTDNMKLLHDGEQTNLWGHEYCFAASALVVDATAGAQGKGDASTLPGSLVVNPAFEDDGIDACAAEAGTSPPSGRRGISRGSRKGSLTLRGFDASETTMEI